MRRMCCGLRFLYHLQGCSADLALFWYVPVLPSCPPSCSSHMWGRDCCPQSHFSPLLQHKFVPCDTHFNPCALKSFHHLLCHARTRTNTYTHTHTHTHTSTHTHIHTHTHPHTHTSTHTHTHTHTSTSTHTHTHPHTPHATLNHTSTQE